MFDAFLNSVLPVFAMVGLGVFARWRGYFAVAEANALSRFVYYVAGPVLLFRLIMSTDFARFNFLQIGAYLAAEIIIYALAYLLFRRVFRRGVRESLLLGMSTVFANHVLYLLPIATYQFGEDRASAIVTFIAGDLFVIYGATLLILDATSPGGASLRAVAGRMASNPQVLALLLGLACNLAGLRLAGGFQAFAQFLGGAASPVSLFALGIVLMAQKGLGDLRVSLSAVGLKLLAMPALATFLLLVVLRQPLDDVALTLLIASAPSGVMTFVLAMRYDIPAQDIGRAAMLSTMLSTFTVSAMLQVL